MVFSTAFARLRKEKGIPQRQVAADLNISQALLSHYENGLREPRLEFVVRACEYYGVSADYLLGRTSVRDNPMLTRSAVESDVDLADMWEHGNMFSLINALTVVTNLVALNYDVKTAEKAYDYLGVSLYMLLRCLGLSSDKELAEFITIPEYKFSPICDIAIKKVEAELSDIVYREELKLKSLNLSVKNNFPAAYAQFLDWFKNQEKKILAGDKNYGR